MIFSVSLPVSSLNYVVPWYGFLPCPLLGIFCGSWLCSLYVLLSWALRNFFTCVVLRTLLNMQEGVSSDFWSLTSVSYTLTHVPQGHSSFFTEGALGLASFCLSVLCPGSSFWLISLCRSRAHLACFSRHHWPMLAHVHCHENWILAVSGRW